MLYWVGKRYSILELQSEYGEGVYTSYTNGKEGWVWFEDANVTFRFEKNDMIIDQFYRGQHGS